VSLPFTVVQQIAYAPLGPMLPGTTPPISAIQLTSFANACSVVLVNDTVRSSKYVAITLPYDTTFTIGCPVELGLSSSSFTLYELDQNCTEYIAANADSGVLLVTKLDAVSLQATYTAHIPGLGTVAGTIDAAICSPVDAGYSGACLP
jgi:hypothetical protein